MSKEYIDRKALENSRVYTVRQGKPLNYKKMFENLVYDIEHAPVCEVYEKSLVREKVVTWYIKHFCDDDTGLLSGEELELLNELTLSIERGAVNE